MPWVPGSGPRLVTGTENCPALALTAQINPAPALLGVVVEKPLMITVELAAPPVQVINNGVPFGTLLMEFSLVQLNAGEGMVMLAWKGPTLEPPGAEAVYVPGAR